jgi:hypothetical protein
MTRIAMLLLTPSADYLAIKVRALPPSAIMIGDFMMLAARIELGYDVPTDELRAKRHAS